MKSSSPDQELRRIEMSSIESGDVIFGRVDRISNSGNGVLDCKHGEILIGSVKPSAVGRDVRAKVWNKKYAFCLTESVQTENYENSFRAKTNQLLSNPPDDCPSPGEVITASVGTPNSSGHTHGKYRGIPLRVRHIFVPERDLTGVDEPEVKVIRVEEGRVVASAILNLEVRSELPERGEEFSAVVSHKSHSGRGLIESFSEGVVNIGPVLDWAVGRQVEAVMVEEGFAYCLSQQTLPDDYDEKMRIHFEDKIARSSTRLLDSLTEDATTNRQRKITTSSEGYSRDPRFRKDVKEAYDHSCAVCGAKRTAPNGTFEVEAAHIYPVSGADEDKNKGGPDEIENGIALCRMHHWAFDNGWFALEDDYTITVRDRPGLPGYEEIEEYDGQQIRLPEKEENQPAVEFIRAHRLRIWK